MCGPSFIGGLVSVLIEIVTVGLLAATALVPVLIAWRATRFWRGFGVAQAINAALAIAFAWWGDARLDLELWWLGRDASQVSFEEQLANVAPENLERAEMLIVSGMGVGWPVHAMVWWPMAALYASFVFMLVWTVRRRWLRSNE